jgi:phage tail protein X
MPKTGRQRAAVGNAQVAAAQHPQGPAVRIVSSEIDITVPLGDGSPVVTAGLGGWQTVDRVDNVSLTDWTGQPPLQQSIPILLDGYGGSLPDGSPREDQSVEQEWNTIKKLARDPNGDEHVPPVFRVEGPIEYSGKAWVLPDNGIVIDPVTIIRGDDKEMTLYRIGFVLNLLEYVPPDNVKLRKRSKFRRNADIGGLGQPGRSGGTPFPGQTYETRKGDTLQSIAHNLYGTWKAAKEIGKLNGIADTLRKLPAGKELKLP